MSQNTVELLGWYGSDEIIASSAWTSTSRDLTPEKRERIPKMLKMLAENGHHTPFEKSSLHFLVQVDVATHIQLLKHRIGVSINGESARYKELNRDGRNLIPTDWPEKWQKRLKEFSDQGEALYHECVEELSKSSIPGWTNDRKRAKESARFFRTYNAQIDMDIMFNWRSFVHFLGLRNKLDAQKEIRDVSADMLELVRTIPSNPFQHTIAAFGL